MDTGLEALALSTVDTELDRGTAGMLVCLKHTLIINSESISVWDRY